MPCRLASPLIDRADDDLAVMTQGGDRQAQQVLIERYRRLARAKGRSYFLAGGDGDDIEQEALIGLYKATRDYRVSRQASFRAFAEVCITRQIITAVKTATRRKHQPLNQYVSISGARDEDHEERVVVEELLDDHTAADPADEVVSVDELGALRSAVVGRLSRFEVAVLHLYVEGRSYDEIGRHLGRHGKAVDNALQRIKRKLGPDLLERGTEGMVLAYG